MFSYILEKPNTRMTLLLVLSLVVINFIPLELSVKCYKNYIFITAANFFLYFFIKTYLNVFI